MSKTQLKTLSDEEKDLLFKPNGANIYERLISSTESKELTKKLKLFSEK